MRVVRYEPQFRSQWNGFVAAARNGVFLFDRGYMEYHADRFRDHSLLFFDEGDEPVAVLPADERDGVLRSHGGLTFGGVLSGPGMKADLMLRVFEALLGHLRAGGFRQLVYKAVPHIYHRSPCEEDLYALFVNGARLVRRDASSTIDLGARPPVSKGRKYGLKQAKGRGVRVAETRDYESFMAIEADHLRRKYGKEPTHTAAELALLASRFPDNVRLFAAHLDGRMVGGVVVYHSPRVAHAQYIAATEEGNEAAAIDAVMSVLLDEAFAAVPYFDFGISTERDGQYLNAGLARYKESYGARTTVYDVYSVEV